MRNVIDLRGSNVDNPIDREMFEIMKKYMRICKGSESKLKLCNLDSSDLKQLFFDSKKRSRILKFINKEFNLVKLLSICKVASYMEIESLTRLACAKVAYILRDNSLKNYTEVTEKKYTNNNYFLTQNWC